MKPPHDFKHNERARVVRLDDEFADRRWLGRVVTVIGRTVDDHGATPKDPLLTVEYRRGAVRQRDAFWATELEPIAESDSRLDNRK